MNKTSWIIIGASGGICLGLGIFLLGPAVLDDWQTMNLTKAAKQELTGLAEKKQVLGELAKNPELNKISETANAYIPEDAKSSELILELTAIVTEAGMSVEQISLEGNSTQPTEEETAAKTASATDKKNKTAEVAGFSLKISGTFENLMQFFKLIETSSRLVAVQGLNLSQEKEEFTAEIKGEAYWKKVQNAEATLANITVLDETLQKFANLKQYSSPIDTTIESGFGRTNPFDVVK